MDERTDGILRLPKRGDDQYCVNCGSRALDTGWECVDCDYDNMPWYSPDGYARLKATTGESP